MVKLLNVGMMLEALEVFVIVDLYRQKKDETAGLLGYARINAKKVLDQLIRSKTSLSSNDGGGVGVLLSEARDEAELQAYIASQVQTIASWHSYAFGIHMGEWMMTGCGPQTSLPLSWVRCRGGPVGGYPQDEQQEAASQAPAPLDHGAS